MIVVPASMARTAIAVLMFLSTICIGAGVVILVLLSKERAL
jgi:hypothetical protein